MATEPSTASASSTAGSPTAAEFHPIDWWADLDDGVGTEQPRRQPPIPAFVRLSRLIHPGQIQAAQGLEPVTAFDTPAESGDPEQPARERRSAARRRPWADSAGRPLFRIGLLSIAAALVLTVATFGVGNDELSAVDSPESATVVDPNPGFIGDGEAAAGADDQTRRVLEAMVRQASGAEADLSIVGSASGDLSELRWTATIRNAGPEPAEGPITIVHTIGADFELTSTAGTGWDCESRPAAGTITCELDEDLGTGQRRRLGLVTTLTGVEPGARVPGTMSVVAGTTDPNLGDNTVNVTATTAPADDDSDGDRSGSTGAAGQVDSEPDATIGAGGGSGSDQTRAAGMEELPHTGSGLAAVLGLIGLGLCLAGRSLMTWSARAQTRTLLVAAHID